MMNHGCAFLLALAIGTGCGSTPEQADSPLSSSAESLLFGGERCSSDRECSSGSCSYGICNGFLMVATDSYRGSMAGGILKAAADPARLKEVTRLLSITLGDFESDPFLRARAADACGLLPVEQARPLLIGHLEDREAPVRFFAARSLHRLGQASGTRVLRSFQSHPSQAVRMLADLELDGSPPPDL